MADMKLIGAENSMRKGNRDHSTFTISSANVNHKIHQIGYWNPSLCSQLAEMQLIGGESMGGHVERLPIYANGVYAALEAEIILHGQAMGRVGRSAHPQVAVRVQLTRAVQRHGFHWAVVVHGQHALSAVSGR